jgi:enamine deaminase RidA (YjgF/YER057c/UK114 family)
MFAYKPLLFAVFALSAGARAEEPAFPIRIPSSGGEVTLPTAQDKRFYDEYHFAAVRRVDNLLYVSGVIVGPRPGEGRDAAAFKLQTKRALERLKTTLAAAGADFGDVAMINTFHVWQSDNFHGTRDEQFKAFSEALADYVHTPYPAWTAVGTTGLLADSGVVEIQLIARVHAR